MQKSGAGVVVLGTGGTIAGTTKPGEDERHYTAAQWGVAQLLASVEGLPAAQVLDCEQVAQVDSRNMSYEVWLRLLERLRHHLSREEVGAVVVTHGTDTLEETAYFLHRVLAPTKPVVLTAAMRPATAQQPDGPQNLRDAFEVAVDPRACGVLVSLNGQVFDAIEVQKLHPSAIDAFVSGAGEATARIVGGEVQWLKPPAAADAWIGRLPASNEAWPRVELVSSHVGADGAVVRWWLSQGVEGLVAVGTGNGTLTDALESALGEAQDAGVLVLRSSRCPLGRLDSAPGVRLPNAGDLRPAKARIELMLRVLARRSG